MSLVDRDGIPMPGIVEVQLLSETTTSLGVVLRFHAAQLRPSHHPYYRVEITDRLERHAS